MLAIPQKGALRVQHNTGAVGVVSPGTVVTTGGAAATKGTPAELIASTNFDDYWVRIVAAGYGVSATTSAGALDILIGAATEEILIPDLLMGFCGALAINGCSPKVWDFPLYIPAGSRIAAQAAGERVSTAMQVWIYLYGGNGVPAFRCGSKVTTYGMGTVPNGTTITPGATGAEGAFAQVTASTTEDHFALVPSFQVSGDASTNVRAFAIDIGLGAATEEEIAQSYWYTTDANEFMSGPLNPMPTFQDIPAGSRLSLRASCSGGLDAGYNGVIHCVS